MQGTAGRSSHEVLAGIFTDAGVHMHAAELAMVFTGQPGFALPLMSLFRDSEWGPDQLAGINTQRAALLDLFKNADFLGLMRRLNHQPQAALSDGDAALLARYQAIQQAVNRLHLAHVGAAGHDVGAPDDGLPPGYYSTTQVQLALGGIVKPVGRADDTNFVVLPPCSGADFAGVVRRMIDANAGRARPLQMVMPVCEGHHWVTKRATIGPLGPGREIGVMRLLTYNSIGSGTTVAPAADTADRLAGVPVLPGMPGIIHGTDTQHDPDSCGARAVGKILDLHAQAHGRPAMHHDCGDRATVRAWMDERAGITAPAAGRDDSSSSHSGTDATPDLLAYDTGYGTKMVTRAMQESLDAQLMREWSRHPGATLAEIKQDVFKSVAQPAGSRPFQAAAAMRAGLSPAEAAGLRGEMGTTDASPAGLV